MRTHKVFELLIWAVGFVGAVIATTMYHYDARAGSLTWEAVGTGTFVLMVVSAGLSMFFHGASVR